MIAKGGKPGVMIGAERACEIVRKSLPADHVQTVRVEDARELDCGWYFPWQMRVPIEYVNGVPMNVPIGSSGIIVNKSSGATFTLGSALNVERDLKFYDLGYQSFVATLAFKS